MIQILGSELENRAATMQGCYMVGVEGSDKVKSVMLNGEELPHCIFADTNIGMVIVNKAHLGGKLMVVDGELVSDILFGDVTVELSNHGMEKSTDEL